MCRSALVSCFLLATIVARAQEVDEREARALALVEEAAQLYRSGQLDGAVERLLEARGVFPEEPAIHYNLARAYEGLGRLEYARDGYQRYLEVAPDLESRGAIESRIESLTRQIAERERLEREREEALAQIDTGLGPGSIVVMATGGATLASSLVTGVLAHTRRQSALDTDTHELRVERFQDAERLETPTNILLGVGASLVAIGLTWLIVELIKKAD